MPAMIMHNPVKMQLDVKVGCESPTIGPIELRVILVVQQSSLPLCEDT